MQLIEHPDSVVIVPLDGNELVVVRHSRPGATAPMFELPRDLPAADPAGLDGDVEVGGRPVAAGPSRLSDAASVAALALWREAR
jgi:hypothetical protein